MRVLSQRFRKDILGIVWASLSLFLGLSLWSFSPEDPSLNSLTVGAAVNNYCGYLGSFVADGFYQFFGLTSWFFVIGCLYRSFLTLKGTGLVWRWYRFLLATVFVVVFSSLLSLYWPQTYLFNGYVPIGGGIGTVVSQGLSVVLNPVGVMLLLWSLVLIFSIFYAEKSLKELSVSGIELAKSGLKNFISMKTKLLLISTYLRDKLTRIKDLQGPSIEMNSTIHDIDEINEEGGIDEESLSEKTRPSKIKITWPLSKSKKSKTRFKKPTRIENWSLPKTDLLSESESKSFKVDQKFISNNIKILEDKLSQFSVNGKVTAVKPGPAVTMYEFKPNADVKISKITDLADDLCLALSAESVRIVAPLTGRDVVGIETSNPQRQTVYLRETIEDETFWDEEVKLPLTLGKQADGKSKVVDLRKMPHLMVAGSTGSGKSVFVVSAIAGLLFKHSPKSLKLILVDPKQVDLAVFHKLPHLLMPPIKEAKKAVLGLKWSIKEMEKRYRSMSQFGARGLEAFNDTVSKLTNEELKAHEKKNETYHEEGRPFESYYYETLPYIVIVVEEFGDLMAVDKQNVEQNVVRLAQMARACGIHLVLAMQSPRKDVVTGLIKTNIPGRISFKVASKMDSRIILDESGAERLLARGDMLFLAPGVAKPERHHGPWTPEDELVELSQFWSEQAEPEYDDMAMKLLEGSGGGYEFSEGFIDSDSENSEDERYDEILSYVSGQKTVSASLLQRKFRLGYPRAARLIEVFEKEGVVGPPEGSKPRAVLINKL